jgi:hypothetical protein
MSSPTNPLNIEDLIAQELAEVDKANGVDVPVAKPEPQPITVTVHGQKLTFANTDELSAQMEKLVGQVTAARKATPTETPKPPAPEPIAPDAKVKKFADLLVQDPGDAVLDAFTEKTGLDITALKAIPELAQRLELIQRQQATDQFMRAHNEEYLPTPENAQALLSTLQQHGLQYTPEGLDAAFMIAKQRNMLKLQDEGAAPQQSRLQAPPRPGRTTSVATPDIYARADELSKEQLEKILRNWQG